MRSLVHRFGRLTAIAILLFLFSPARVSANDDEKAGAIYYVNRTSADIEIKGRYVIDADGDKVSMPLRWKLKAGQSGYLTLGNKKLVARRFAYTLTTADGSTDWTSRAAVLDKDGDFVLVLTADNLAQHRRTLRGRGAAEDGSAVKARRTKEAWDAMGKVDAITSPIARRDAVEYWEKFNIGYGLIDKDDIDVDLDRLIRSWVALSADYHATIVKYRRSRAALVKQREDLGPCPDGAGKAFLWGLAWGALTRQISDLDDGYRTSSAALSRKKADVEKRETALASTLAGRYPAFRFSR